MDEERKRRRNVEDELSVTRKRLLMFTQRSIPRRSNRVVRRIDSYEDGEESTVTLERATSDEDNEDTRVNKLIHVMNSIYSILLIVMYIYIVYFECSSFS